MQSLLQILAGTWFIVSTNFPMWLKGDKTHPAFHYEISERKGVQGLDDKVTYQKKGRTKTIHGFDFPKAGNGFTWKGYGLLAITKSKWEVRLLDEHHQWAVIYFSKTLFTPEGVDIIARSETLPPEELELIRQKMAADSLLREFVWSIRELPVQH